MLERQLEEEGMGPLEIGRRRYQKGDFKGALEGFTEAISVCTDHLQFNALDHRAATYEKLGQLQLALRDAKAMIDLMPRLSKGYLRCGKVLQLKGEPAVALKIYDRGLKKVKIGADKDRTNLQAMYNKVRESLNPALTRDPLQYLPLELAEMVISNLNTRDKVVCLAVSKGWKRLLESSPKLWTTFDSANAKRAISGKSLKAHLRRSHWTLDRAIISMRANIDKDKLAMMTKNCKKLREVQFVGTGLVGDTLFQALPQAKSLDTLLVGRGISISLSTVQTLLADCKESLTDITFLNVAGSPGGIIAGRWAASESLKSIHLQSNKDSCLDIEGLCKATPNAESVILNDWKVMPVNINLSSWTKAKHLDLSNAQLQRWPILPSSLTHLIVSNNTLLNIPTDDPDPVSLPLLETFACHSTFITPVFLKIIVQASIKAGNLKRLSIGGRNTDFRDSPVAEEFPPSDTVEELSVAAMIIGDPRMVQITALYPNLKKLDVSATKITGVAVREFVNSGIKSLKLNDCQNVKPDAVDWARAKGVEVEYLFPSRSTHGGRTQRYGDSTFARGF